MGRGVEEVIKTEIFDIPDRTMIIKARIYLNTQSLIRHCLIRLFRFVGFVDETLFLKFVKLPLRICMTVWLLKFMVC